MSDIVVRWEYQKRVISFECCSGLWSIYLRPTKCKIPYYSDISCSSRGRGFFSLIQKGFPRKNLGVIVTLLFLLITVSRCYIIIPLYYREYYFGKGFIPNNWYQSTGSARSLKYYSLSVVLYLVKK